MRQGKAPEAACLAALERVVRNTKLDYLRDEKGRRRTTSSCMHLTAQEMSKCCALGR